MRADSIHGAGDREEVAEKLQNHVFVVRVVCGQLQRDFQHVLAEQSHPGRAVRLLQVASGGQRRAAVKDADVVQPQESSLEKITTGRIFAVYPPGEVEQQLPEGILEKLAVIATVELFVDTVREQSRPGVDRRIDIAEVPFVGRNLAARMQVELVQHQVKLLFGEIRVDHVQREGVKGQVPGCVPRILPL